MNRKVFSRMFNDKQFARDELGKNIRIARLAAGLTQVDLGSELGVYHSTIADIEGGRKGVSYHLFLKICYALDESPGILMGIERRI